MNSKIDNKDIYSMLAEYEIGWWKAHHRKDNTLLTENMAKLYGLQFGISYDNAVKAVEYRVKATKEHDIAEKLEDNNNQPEANEHWKKAEDLIKEHFIILTQHLKSKK